MILSIYYLKYSKSKIKVMLYKDNQIIFKDMIKKNFYDFFFKKFLHNKIYMTGLSHLLNMREKYSFVNSFSDVDYKIFSQNGEDGIIDYLLSQLSIEKPKFVEIGVGDYTEANTRFVFERTSAKGVIIDCIYGLEKKISKNLATWRGELNVINRSVNSKNIIEILSTFDSLRDLDLFSIDIDGIDYWILNKLPENFSKIAIIEYNPIFGKDIEVSVPNIDNFNRTKYHYSNLCFGMSLKAAIKIMQSKNFYFLGTNLFRNNAFFVSNDFKKNKYFSNLEINELEKYVDSNFSESRNKNGKLNFLNKKKQIMEILDCEIVDLSQDKFIKKKLKEIIDI